MPTIRIIKQSWIDCVHHKSKAILCLIGLQSIFEVLRQILKHYCSFDLGVFFYNSLANGISAIDMFSKLNAISVLSNVMQYTIEFIVIPLLITFPLLILLDKPEIAPLPQLFANYQKKLWYYCGYILFIIAISALRLGISYSAFLASHQILEVLASGSGFLSVILQLYLLLLLILSLIFFPFYLTWIKLIPVIIVRNDDTFKKAFLLSTLLICQKFFRNFWMILKLSLFFQIPVLIVDGIFMFFPKDWFHAFIRIIVTACVLPLELRGFQILFQDLSNQKFINKNQPFLKKLSYKLHK